MKIFKESQIVFRFIDKEEYNKIIEINNEIKNLDENQINAHIRNIKKTFIKNFEKYVEYNKKLEVIIEKFKELLAKIAAYIEKSNDAELKKQLKSLLQKWIHQTRFKINKKLLMN
ncbi:Uncharacterised protein [Mesomycoplasma conjunctivae]|uniref:Uncharacterized protein n=1 Tax=Mesomycoplasma conjunctivae (strain ATCC 25834 / NCTC 10147 / HRC/581) TaxID=572263 RepID=C5J624_MESCH|nr:hypothetical protein [Mesomycoplasma conjunctivae]CAT04916.1 HYPOTHETICAL PROTEIN MCJ_002250 [Mesomycoplasma conjunctivae]VEU66043.1 Uncharacterised protein [Mesomycoplasma conjunctivae]